MPNQSLEAHAKPALDSKMNQLTASTDLLADLSIGADQGHKTEEVEAAVLAASGLDAPEQFLAVVAEQQQGEVTTDSTEAAAEQLLTPEQDAAATECADQFVDLYEHAYLNRAVQLLDTTCREQGISESAVAQKLRGRGMDLDTLKGRAAEVARGIAECASDEGWRLIQDGKLRLLYRHTPGSTVHSFKGSCLLPAPMNQPMSMAREFDLVNSWNSYITNSSILRTYCEIDLLVYASVWLPWPFAERDVVISAVADDQLKEHGVVAISFTSPREVPSGVDLPGGADKRVHIYFTPGSCMTMTPVPPAAAAAVTVGPGGAVSSPDTSAQQTQVVVVANIETSMPNVPEAIISFVLKVFAPFMYSTVLKTLHSSFDDPSEPLPRRMAANHELYDMIMIRAQHYLDGHPD